jgi:hypothetical protein
MTKMINPEIFNAMLRSPKDYEVFENGLVYELRTDDNGRDIIVTSTRYTTLKEFNNMTYGWATSSKSGLIIIHLIKIFPVL